MCNKVTHIFCYVKNCKKNKIMSILKFFTEDKTLIWQIADYQTAKNVHYHTIY